MTYNKKVLPNGVRVLTIPMKDSLTVTVSVMVEVGSEYEPKEISGISHFLEHMCFKGTTKRPTSMSISHELDSLGASYNAFTSQEYTGYYAKGSAEYFSKLFDVVSDIYLNSTLPAKDMEKEKGVVVEEIRMYNDMPKDHVHEVFTELVYGDQPAGRSIAGTEETVTSLSQKSLKEYRDAHYVPESTVVCIAGKFDERLALQEIEKAFGSLKKGKKVEKAAVTDVQNGVQIKLVDKKSDQAHFVLGVRSWNIYNDRIQILRVLRGVLSGGMSARLWHKLREELGICYYVSGWNDIYTDHGIFAVSAGVDTKRVGEAVSGVMIELARLKDELVPATELRKVKDSLRGRLDNRLETSDEISSFYESQEIHHEKIKTPADIKAEIEAVTAEDIRKLARELFVEKNLNFALIGPYRDEAALQKILHF